MKTEKFLEMIRSFNKPVFTFNDVSKLLGDPEYTRLFLFRVKQKGYIIGIERGKYALRATNIYALASNILHPSYISFISALSYYKLTTQIPKTIFVVSLKQKKEITFREYSIRFVKFKHFRFFGYRREKIDGKIAFIAEPEKCIVDSVYLIDCCPLSEVLFALKNYDFDVKKILDYALRMNSPVLLKRIGYLLELSGVDVFGELRDNISHRYNVLNPLLKKRGKKNKKWKLVINEVL